MKQNTSGPSKNSPSQKKRSEKPNVLKFCVLDREYLPTTSIEGTQRTVVMFPATTRDEIQVPMLMVIMFDINVSKA
jgi:hypothetical protein